MSENTNALRELETWLGTYADSIPAQAYRDLCAIQTALAERDARGGDAWQPIETAPKDRDVLLYFGPDEITTGRWYPLKSFNRDVSYWKPLVMSSHGCGCCGGDDDAPTHWMPLPAPPALAQAPETSR